MDVRNGWGPEPCRTAENSWTPVSVAPLLNSGDVAGISRQNGSPSVRSNGPLSETTELPHPPGGISPSPSYEVRGNGGNPAGGPSLAKSRSSACRPRPPPISSGAGSWRAPLPPTACSRLPSTNSGLQPNTTAPPPGLPSPPRGSSARPARIPVNRLGRLAPRGGRAAQPWKWFR